MRRALSILAILIILGGAAFAAYYYFFMGKGGVAVSPTVRVGFDVGGPAASSTEPSTSDATTTQPIETRPEVAPRLVQVAKGPVVPGFAVTDGPHVSTTTPTEIVVTYIDRQSGNIYRYQTQKRTLTRISNKTIPGLQSATWFPDASLAYVRYLSGTDFATVNTYALPANGNAGYFLKQNVADISVSSSSVLLLASGVTGSVASLARLDGTKETQLFTTPLSSLRTSFAGKGQYLAFTKPTATLEGSAYLVDAAGRFSRIAGPESGLVALASPLGTWVLVSATTGSSLSLRLVNTKTGESLPLPVSTIADKCAWAADETVIYCGIPTELPSGAYPDDWYQGALSFSDRVWKINVVGRYAELVLDFSKEMKTSLDAASLALDASQRVLVFMNKTDSSLWSYQLR